MQAFYLILDIIAVVALLGLGLTVLMKSVKLELNNFFALFSLFVSVWIIANYISNDIDLAPSTARFANYFVFTAAYGAMFCLLRFIIKLTDDTKARRFFNVLTVPLLLVNAIAPTSLVVSDVELQGQVYAVHFGPLAAVYFVTLVFIIFAGVYLLYRNLRRAHHDQRSGIRVLLRSWAWTLPIVLLANLILPTLTGWFGLSNIGVLPIFVLVYGLYYSVVKHRLFDLRWIIVRSVAYVITLGMLSVFYAASSHYISTFFDAHNTPLISELANVVFIVIVIVVYPTLKKSFDKLTNSLFYRDAYDAEDLYAHLNRVMVSTYRLDQLLTSVTELLATELKATFVAIELKEVTGKAQRIVGTSQSGVTAQDIAAIRRQVTYSRQSLIITDMLDEKGGVELRKILTRNDISVLVKLAPRIKHEKDDFGYMILGPKQSGNIYARQDFRVLETIANELIIAIQNALHFEEIQNFNKTLQEKVVEATRELRRTNEKLKSLDETKDDFISMASHQLRTPLTSVKGYLSMVLDGDAGKLTALERKMLTQAFISSQRMVYLISDLLNVSRLKTGKFVIERAPVNLADIISDEIAQLTETAATRDLSLQYDKPKAFPTVALDETKTRQVVMNFIDNAIYYTPAGGHIRIELVDLPRTVELRVIDDGIGVPKSEQHHLFTKFYRAGNARKARPDGTGLGLFMARKVVIAQNGSIIFKSAEGQGSTFGFSFPKSAPPTESDTKHTP